MGQLFCILVYFANEKNTIRDEGSTAIYAVYTVDMVYTVDTVDNVSTIGTNGSYP